MTITKYLDDLNQNTPILITGQTASGKSHLAIKIAEEKGGTIINADAIQVYNNRRILTARPSIAAEAKISHKLYGHIDGATEYSVGTWIKEIKDILLRNTRPIIVGGTGLYFSALTNGLVDIPEISEAIRLEANNRIKKNGLESLLKEIDEETTYLLPKHLLGIIWKGRYKGQKQKWFLMRYLGNDNEININTKKPEFLDWKWIDIDHITDVVVDFKLEVYKIIQKKIRSILN